MYAPILSTIILNLAVIVLRRTIVLCLFTWVVAAIGYGAFSLEVTTDPVEIWAAPESRSRIEKDYFDTYFQPFYRTEQVFIKTVGISSVG